MPTENLGVAHAALAAIQAGQSAREGLANYRASGGHVANETWFRVTAELQTNLAAREGIYSEPVGRIPIASEIQRWTTQKARGYVQQVEVLARDRATGEVISIPYSLTGKTLHSRNYAIRQALDVYKRDTPSGEGQQILGAIYSGTFEAVPEGG